MMKRKCRHCLVKPARVNTYYCSRKCEIDYYAHWSQGSMLTIGDSQTKGYSGYNHGLDAHVSNRGDWKRLAKQKGLKPVDGW